MPNPCQSVRSATANKILRDDVGTVQTSFFEDFEDKDILSRPQRIPLFDIDQEDRMTSAFIPLPPEVKPEYLAPEHLDELQIARLKKLPAGAALQCEVIRIPHSVQENDEAPYLPAMMLMLRKSAEQVVPVELVHNAVYSPDEMAEKTLNALVNMKKRPRVIEVRTEETQAILAGICQAAGITLTVKNELPALREAHDYLRKHMEGMDDEDMGPIDMEASDFDPNRLSEEEQENLQEMLMMLSDMSVSDLRRMPDDMYSFITYLDAQGFVPEALSKKLKNIIRKR